MGIFGMSASEFIYRAIAVLFALSAHEYAHAAVAYQMGDKSQKYMGRLTLNPLAHLDPVGTMLLLFARVGWAKPVMINPRSFKDARLGMILVSLAGPGCNLLLAFLFILPFRLGLITSINPELGRLLSISVLTNIGLAAFNLIPIPPLDGSKVLAGLLPGRQARSFEKMETYGPILLILMVVTGMTNIIFEPIFTFLYRLIT